MQPIIRPLEIPEQPETSFRAEREAFDRLVREAKAARQRDIWGRVAKVSLRLWLAVRGRVAGRRLSSEGGA
ncbi:MAG: hypothetical protein AAGA87_15945 [Pseudomonadota bacterium]